MPLNILVTKMKLWQIDRTFFQLLPIKPNYFIYNLDRFIAEIKLSCSMRPS